jgi:lipopolysaccharide export LptBFGC system permease protein LptF
VPGLAWTELCPECRWEREARARRLSSWIALAATALMALYLTLRLPAHSSMRFYAIVAVLATYIIVRRIVTRLAMEFLPK